MSRQSTLQTTALLCLLGMQAWLVYRVETAMTHHAGPVTEANNKVLAPASATGSNVNNSAAFTAQINARISALENRGVTTTDLISRDEAASIVLDGAEALAADRKLEAMLPKEPLTHEELIIFQAQLGQLPVAERHQLLAALSRAINNGRVQPKLK